MKKLILMVAMFGMVGATSVKASETQASGELIRTTAVCKNGIFEGFKNNTDHAVNYEFIGMVDRGGVRVLETQTNQLYPGWTQLTDKGLAFTVYSDPIIWSRA